jgi:putative ABC transport system permease protein
MVKHERRNYAGAVAGTAFALFLVLLQVGFYFGFRRDISIIQDSCNADIWIVPKALRGFDYSFPVEDAVYATALSTPGVESAARVVFDWARWRTPVSGEKEGVQLLGIEFDRGIEFDLGVRHQNLTALLGAEGCVLIDPKDRANLGLTRSNQKFAEINGRRAEVVGYVKDRHLFTTLCLVVTDLDNARAFLGYPVQHVSYIAIRCDKDENVALVMQRLQARIPDDRVMSARQLHDLTQHYWTSRTGIGPILSLAAVLATLVGFLTVMLTFYLLTAQKMPVFAALKALGASGGEIAGLIGVQASVCFLAGMVAASIAVAVAMAALSQTTISVVISPSTALAVTGLIALASALACIPAVRKIMRLEPAEAFRA